VDIRCPQVIDEYNKSMGDVDLNYLMISYYRLKARTGKWMVRTIMHLFDLSQAYSWLQYCHHMKKSGARAQVLVWFGLAF
jgi:hypothetical protein